MYHAMAHASVLFLQAAFSMDQVGTLGFYWCWCSVLGGLIIPADSLSTSLDMGLSIAFKAGELMLRWL